MMKVWSGGSGVGMGERWGARREGEGDLVELGAEEGAVEEEVVG